MRCRRRYWDADYGWEMLCLACYAKRPPDVISRGGEAWRYCSDTSDDDEYQM